MKEKLPYEKIIAEKLNDTHLPDEEQSWQKMKKLLDEDEDDTLIPPIFLKGCVGLFILIGILVGGYYILKISLPGKNSKQIISSKIAPDSVKPNFKIENTHNDSFKISINQQLTVKKNSRVSNTDTGVANIVTTLNTKQSSIKKKSIKKISPDKTLFILNSSENKIPEKDIDVSVAEKEKTIISVHDNKKTQDTSFTSDNKDSLLKKQDIVKNDSARSKNKIKEKPVYSFSAGIALQQSIPVNGQKAVPYNYYGRIGSLADYIPSAYGRIYKNNKWFLQGEFKFGAPQYVKEFTYSDEIVGGVGPANRHKALSLKKTYYHQIPVSINYFITPKWSIGTGFMYSKFYAAVAEEVIKIKNVTTQQDTILSKSLIQVKGSNADSFFTKSLLHYLFETQYKFKKWSIGLRYTQGIQPYIKYLDQAGNPAQQKNQSLQLFIRYELWRAKK